MKPDQRIIQISYEAKTILTSKSWKVLNKVNIDRLSKSWKTRNINTLLMFEIWIYRRNKDKHYGSLRKKKQNSTVP